MPRKGTFGIYLGGDLQYEFKPHDQGKDWVLTPQRTIRPISPGGAEVRDGKKVVGHIKNVRAQGLRWMIIYDPVPEPEPEPKKKRKPRRIRRKPAEASSLPVSGEGSFGDTPVSVDE